MEVQQNEDSDMSIEEPHVDGEVQPHVDGEAQPQVDGDVQTHVDGGAFLHTTDGNLPVVEENGLTPKVGMIFKSLQEALDYYDEYARRVGFGIIRRSSKFRDDGQFDSIVLACSSGGKPRSRPDGPSRRVRRITKTNCKAKMVVRLRDDGLFHVGYLILDHNHEVNPSKVASLKPKKVSTGMDLDSSINHPVSSKMSKDLTTIEKISSALIGIGCPAHIFAPESFLYQGFLTSGQFAGYLRILTHHTEPAKLEHIMEAAISNRVIITIQSMTFSHLMNFLSWLKTPRGREAMGSALNDEKVVKRGKYIMFSSNQMSELEAFDAFLDEYEATLEGRREKMECTIKELTTKIQQEKDSFESDMANYWNQFHPVSAFSPLVGQTINQRCWDCRCAQSEAASEAPPILTFSTMDRAIELFSNEVRMEHILQFIQQGENMQKIQAWVDSKICFFKQSGDEKSATHLRHMLEAMGVTEASDFWTLGGMVPTDFSVRSCPNSEATPTLVPDNLEPAR